MNNKHRNITLNQFDLMKHALGIDEYTKPKRGTYKAYLKLLLHMWKGCRMGISC